MKKVLVLDSGIGGLCILHECVKLCPYFNYLYFADTLNLPYGEKDEKKLLEITTSNLKDIQSYFPFEYVIIACNTLTSVAIKDLRKTFTDVTFIGTEPAVKPALTKYSCDELILIATQNTIQHSRVVNYAKEKNIFVVALSDFAKVIEDNIDNMNYLKAYIKNNLTKICFEKKGIILGCTHYELIADLIEKELHFECFKSANGVAKRLKDLYIKKLHKSLSDLEIKNKLNNSDYLIQFQSSSLESGKLSYIYKSIK